jgi:ELWxxDGT repeat protein
MRKYFLLSCLLSLLALHSFAQSPQLIRDIFPGMSSSVGPSITTMVPIGDTLYLSAANGWDGNQLWMHDGSPTGGKALKCIAPAYGASAQNFIRMGGKTYFTAVTLQGMALWETDGSVGGTQEILAFPSTLSFPKMYRLGNQLLIFVLAGGSQSELWVSDGTASGTANLVVMNQHVDQSEITPFANGLYFTAGTELWKTDGTALGTDLVVDIHPFSPDDVENLTVFDGKLWFSAIDAAHGRELWSTDGTIAGTSMFDDYLPGSADGVIATTNYFKNMHAAGGQLYFQCTDGGLVHGAEVRTTDGTLAGTTVIDYTPGPNDSQFEYWAASSNHLFFNELNSERFCAILGNTVTILDSLNSTRLTSWRNARAIGDTLVFLDFNAEIKISDGTVNGTHALLPGAALIGSQITGDGNAVYFVGRQSLVEWPKIWKTDGSIAGTVQYSMLYPPHKSSYPRGLMAGGQGVFFQAIDSLHGEELWHTDGTAANTVLLQDIALGTDNLYLGDKYVWNDVLYFSGGAASNQQELWRSDGTVGGTMLLKALSTPNLSSDPSNFLATDSALYFLSYSNSLGRELWRTDGTTTGTTLVLDPHFVSILRILGRLGNNVLFLAQSSDLLTIELWITSGVPGVATMLARFDIAQFALGPYFLGKQYFVTKGQGAQPQLWTTQGTAATTVEFTQQNTSQNPIPAIWGNVHGKLLFTMSGAASGNELWITDGNVGGTQLLRDIRLGALGSDPQLIALDDSLAYFQADDGQNGQELWRTDGTVAGTYLVMDVNAGPESSSFTTPILHAHKLYCAAQAAATGKELLESDGTALGTISYDLLPGPTPSNPRLQFYTDQGLLFEAGEQDYGFNLYLLHNGVVTHLPDPTGDPQGFVSTSAIPYGSGIVLSGKSTIYGHELFFLDSLQGISTEQIAAIKPVAGLQVSAYPVPTQAQVTLQVRDASARIYGYGLYDLAGQCVRQASTAPQAAVLLELADLPTGLYLVRVDLGKAGMGTVKVVKQ